MDAKTLRNRRKLTDLFNGPFPGHAILMSPEARENTMQPHGDFTRPELPLTAWLPMLMQRYEDRLRYHEALSSSSAS